MIVKEFPVDPLDPNATVPVAVKLARETLPEKRPLPWTERSEAGVVVPMPTLPSVVAKYAEPVEPICVVEAYPSVVSPVTLRVPVAIKLARETLPEKRPLPWTESLVAGVVVPMPTLPSLG